MASGIEIKLDVSVLRALRGAIPSRAEKLLDIQAREFEERTKENIETMGVVDIGNLLNSIHVEDTHPPLQRTIADGVTYGIFQHEGYHDRGGGYHQGRPFMRLTADTLRKRFQDAWKGLF